MPLVEITKEEQDLEDRVYELVSESRRAMATFDGMRPLAYGACDDAVNAWHDFTSEVSFFLTRKENERIAQVRQALDVVRDWAQDINTDDRIGPNTRAYYRRANHFAGQAVEAMEDFIHKGGWSE